MDYLLDTSALIALRTNEPGADQVERLLRRADAGELTLFLSCISVMELFYIVFQRQGDQEAYTSHLYLKQLPLEWVWLDESLLLAAGKLKARHAISFADAVIAATAMQKKARLVHKDPEFETLKDQVTLEALPYKTKRK